MELREPAHDPINELCLKLCIGERKGACAKPNPYVVAKRRVVKIMLVDILRRVEPDALKMYAIIADIQALDTDDIGGWRCDVLCCEFRLTCADSYGRSEIIEVCCDNPLGVWLPDPWVGKVGCIDQIDVDHFRRDIGFS